MATLRSQAAPVAQNEGPSSAPLQADLEIDRLSQGLATWDTKGQETVKQILSSQTDSATLSASTIPISNTLIKILQSEIAVKEVTKCLQSVTEPWETERKDVLWEALMDAVAVLSEARDDSRDLKPAEGMEVDGQTVPHAADKGVQIVKALLATNTIPAAIPSLMSSPTILGQLGLIPYTHNEQTFGRSFVKRSTALFYKQSKYNLLRESSEGFSGLIVLLTSGDALAGDSLNETETEVRARAQRVWSKIMGLIGYFNLSPPRVLDIILEIASCHVAAHWRFWLELIRASPWGGAEKSSKGKEKATAQWAEEECDALRGVLQWDGDRVLAQVLGAKFGFCQRPDGGDTPLGLVYMAALLVKHGFVGLVDILPFLSPNDEEMENIRQRFIESTVSRSGPNNALANSILTDDDPPSASSSKDVEPSGPPAKPPQEQRIQLLQALLSVGDVAAAQYFLAKYPWTAQSHPAISDLILRLIATALEDVFREEVPGFDAVDESLDHVEIDSEKEVVPTLYAPSPPETSTKVFKFFYPDWRNGVEKWNSWQDIHDKGLRWFSLVRGMGGRAGSVMAKICRIGTKHFVALRAGKEAEFGISHGTTKRNELRDVEPSPAEMEPWINILRVILLPALSNSSATAPFDIDLWALIKHFPYTVRYQLYGEWRDFTCDARKANFNCPIAVKAAAECTRDIKKALSRVTASQSSALPSSQERGPARALAKLSHTNPCALWATAVTQVKAYPNIGSSIVDAGRYMNQLAMDVATFTLVDVLASEKGLRTNPQGTEVAQWLENIAAFVGDFNRRYQSMDLEPILQYIINKLMRGESDDLTILSRVIQRMYGVDTVENNGVSDAQLEAYATGKAMVHESFWTTQIAIAKPTDDPANKAKTAPTDKTKNTKKSLPRLISALRDTKLAIPIWIALAQTRQGVVDKLVERQPDTPLKALGLMHDKVHDIFIQYGDLLGEQLTGEELITLVPDFATLTNDFGLDHSMAFQVIRPRLHAQIVKEDGDKLAQLKERLMAQKEASKANGTGGVVTPPLTPPLSPRIEETIKEFGVNGNQIDSITVPEPKMSIQRGKYHPALQTTMEQASRVLSEHALNIMGAPFFMAFWQLSMSDIAFSAETYKSAIARIKVYDKEVGSWKGGSLAAQREERRRLMDQCDLLIKERDSQSAYVERTRKRLRLEAPTWFQQEGTERLARNDLALQLHQYCFYPRALLTPADAVYVPRLIRLLHDIGTPGFSTVFAYLHFFQEPLAACIFACTESEARNLARCLKTILVDVDSWHKDEKKYEREALGKTASSALPGMLYQPKAGLDPRQMIWTGFRTLVFKFHTGLFRAIKSCWEQKDFMHVKNGITVALQVLPIFPLVEDHGKELFKVMEVLEKRSDLTPDLKQGCKAYMVQLQKRTSVRPYVPQDGFSGAPKIAAAPSGSASAKAPPSGPAKAVNGQAPSPLARAASATGQTATTTKTLTEQEALRQKVKETRAKTATSNVKEARRSAPPAGPSAQSGDSKDRPVDQARNSEGRDEGKPPPAGPRSTRATASVPPAGPATNVRVRGASDRTPAAPSRLAKTSSPAPSDILNDSTVPTNTAADQAEKARQEARAARFRTLESNPQAVPAARNSSPTPASAANTPGRDKKADTPMGPPAARKDDGRHTPQTRSPRRPSSPVSGPGPSSRTRRSGSIESRTSDRSRTRSAKDREREDQERDKIRAERNSGTAVPAQGSRTSTPVRESTVDTPEGARKKQEDILQARHEKLAAESQSDERRSSSSRRDKETEQERADRKAKEKADDREREKDKDKSRDDAGTKRKREEAPRIIDPLERPADRRRSDREKRDRDDRRHDDRDRGHDRDRDRREHRHDEPRDSRDDRRPDTRDRRAGPRDARDDPHDRERPDRRNDIRDRDRERDRPRDGRADDRERDRPRDTRPDERDRDRDNRRRPNDRELLPQGNAAPSRSRDQSPRDGRSGPALSSVEPVPRPANRSGRDNITPTVTHPLPQPPNRSATPTNGRLNESPAARAPHALPARPGMRSDQNNGTPVRPVASQAPGSLASRMGPALNTSSPGPARPRSPPNPPPADQPAGNGVGSGDTGTPPSDLKRPHDDAPQLAREGSADLKRRKIVREKARRDDGGASGGTGRLLAGAMRAANDK